ncbi:glycosyltransferase [Pseudalkalibacillus salsuginis]|uniref:glycosyltransferase n=1 Tax=Pseudalkalibacillus salsuginis TaxID=2910972 RepID=UPI001F3A170A|nr:glycosyltransferase [Pseudalkalibacillus salsuginis]MCF6409168.1 glycosyltransferase [Pseudalkalibacillus salsuginis]
MIVSVVRAVHNGEEYLTEAIDSITSHTYSKMELIIVNDASRDDTKKILDDYSDNRIKVIHLKTNMGAAYALNLAIEHANGDWIAVHDADDLSYPNRLEEQVNYIKKHPELIGVGSFIECITCPNSQYSERELRQIEFGRNHTLDGDQIKSALYHGCPFTHGTIMYSKKAILKAGRYDPTLRIAYDYDLWTRLITIGPIINVPEVLYKYRRYNESLSSKNITRTNEELLYSFLKYIRKSCFMDNSNKPSVAIFGNLGSEKLTLPNDINVKTIFSKGDSSTINHSLTLLKEEKIDGIIILNNLSGWTTVIRQLQINGLELNKEFFAFYLA